ncbi:alpha/beta hydrolase [Planomonospora parontospora subsp. parontospora]|uniref:Alpha/beta hydrolase n=2 Tax=Planomonospora parontospora TaxID=58119 RepID=A0AA37F4R6_9ACTN|nr:alpha/beta hydrolase [Planomonospora parontospora]GGK68241.1 alpha/beta hydrolase [Planomonospora parontospora]GII09057.1 alpha/beta hydrolase [Planomonospora parontospora subsp. parontospora]
MARFARPLTALLATAAAASALTTAAPAASAATASPAKPTIVLVHGAFADASSWNGVAERLQRRGYTVIASANPLRGLADDAAATAALLKSIKGPVVLAGHSYGGAVITNAARGNDEVKALVYIAAFIPEKGESAADLAGRHPGSTLGETLREVPLPGGGTDLYVRQDRFRKQFAHDVPARDAKLMAAAQRPVTAAALNEPSGVPAWKDIASWVLVPTGDKNIPPAALRFMAKRAEARATVEIEGASHAVLVSRPDAVADLIERAAAGRR